MKNIINKYSKNIISNKNYDSFINKEIIKRMIDHLEYVNIKPKLILCFCLNNNLSNNLKSFFPNSKVINLFFYRDNIIDIKSIKNESIDLIMFNFSINWCSNFAFLLSEIRRVSKNNTLFLFSNINFFKINEYYIYNKILDNYKFGNILFKYDFKNIVIDNNNLKLNYITYKKFFEDIISSGLFFLGNVKLKKIILPIDIKININFGCCSIMK